MEHFIIVLTMVKDTRVDVLEVQSDTVSSCIFAVVCSHSVPSRIPKALHADQFDRHSHSYCRDVGSKIRNTNLVTEI